MTAPAGSAAAEALVRPERAGTRPLAHACCCVLAGMLLIGPGPTAQATALAEAADAAAVVAGPAAIRYEVEALRDGAELRVSAELPPTRGAELRLAAGFSGFARDVHVDDGSGRRPVAFDRDRLELPSCERAACRVEYRFRLDEAARGRRRRGEAISHSGAWLSPPSTWLLRPVAAPDDTRFSLRVRTSGEVRFVSGLPRAGGADTYAGALRALEDAPYSGFGRFDERRLEIGGSAVDLAIAPGARTLSTDALAAWALRAASGVSAYLGGLPVPRVLVIVLPGAGRRPVGYGSTMGNGGASIMVSIAGACAEADLREDWVLVHEMVHLALPNLPRRHRWVEEGLSTYVEPVIRARLGLIGPAERWAELVRSLPKGQPRPGDSGLDLTPSWGSTYWGGALFWFLADLEIRERSGNRLGLEDAVRGIAAAGGSIAVSWDLERLLRAGDAALGLDVLAKLHARMGSSPWGVDLDDLWRRLGVVPAGDSVRLERDAPLAAVRDAMLSSKPDRPAAGAAGVR